MKCGSGADERRASRRPRPLRAIHFRYGWSALGDQRHQSRPTGKSEVWECSMSQPPDSIESVRGRTFFLFAITGIPTDSNEDPRVVFPRGLIQTPSSQYVYGKVRCSSITNICRGIVINLRWRRPRPSGTFHSLAHLNCAIRRVGNSYSSSSAPSLYEKPIKFNVID